MTGLCVLLAAAAPYVMRYAEPADDWNEALPKAWPAGRVTGLRARGGYLVDLVWKDGKVTDVNVLGGKSDGYELRAEK